MSITLIRTRLKRAFDYLTYPAFQLESQEQFHKAQLLAAVSLALLTAAMVAMPMWVITAPSYPIARYLMVATVFLFGLAYHLSRTRSHQLAALLLISVMLILVVIPPLTAPGPMTERMLSLNFLTILVILTNFFLSRRSLLFVIGLSLVIISSFFFNPEVPFAFTYSYLVYFLVTTGLGSVAGLLSRRVKNELAGSESRYRSVLTAMTEGVVLQGKDGAIQACNAAAEQILGLTAAQMRGHASVDPHWRAIREDGSPFPGETHPAMITLRSGQPLTGVIMGIHKPNGELRWISINSQPLIQDGEVLPYAVVTTFTDITERRQAEETLRYREINFRTLFNTVNDFLFVLDMQGNIQQVNETVIQRLEYSEAELINQPVLIVHPEARRDETAHIVMEMLQGKRAYCPVPLQSKSGTLIPVETYITQGQWNGQPALFGVTKDISALKLSEEKFSKAFHINPAIVGLSNIETGEYVEVNQTFYDKLGFTPDEVIGKRAVDFLRLDFQYRERVIAKLKQHGSIRDEEAVIYTKEGKPLSVLLSAEMIKLDNITYNFTTAVDITERKQMEEALRQSELRYRSVVDAQAELICRFLPDSTLVFVNDAFCQYFGRSREELVGHNFLLLIPEDQREAVYQRFLGLFENPGVEEYEQAAVVAHGEIRWQAWTSRMILDEHGTLSQIQAVGRDITERKRHARALAEAQHRYQALFSQSHDAVFMIGLDGRHLDANQRASDLLGYTIEEFRQGILYTDTSAEVSNSIDTFRRLLAGEHVPVYERVFRKKDGSLISTEVNAELVRDLDDKPLHIQSVVRDITRRKQMEEALRQNEARTLSLLNNMEDIVWSVELPAYQTMYLNPALESVYGRPATEFYADNQLWTKVIHPEDAERIPPIIDKMMQNGFRDIEYRIVRPDGDICWLRDRGWVVNDEQGHPIRLEGIANDITAQKQLVLMQQAFLEAMQALQNLHLELSEIEVLDTLYQKMIELSRLRLGLDRIGLFVTNPEGDRLLGTYGVDQEGHFRNEAYYQEVITPDHWSLGVLHAPGHAQFWDNAPIYDNGIQVGIGWKAASALWNGQRAVGYIVTDNFMLRKAARPYEIELLSLLGSILGHLIERKQAEHDLRQSEARQRALLNALPDLMFRTHIDGTFLDYHAHDRRDLALLPEQFMGRKVNEVAPPTIVDAYTRLAEQVIRTGQESALEYPLELSGVMYDFEARMVAVGEDQLITIVRNITTRKLAERQAFELALEKGRMRLLSQFIEKASHEFRTPLSMINSAAYLIVRLEDTVKRQNRAALIETQVRQIDHLVDMMSKMTRLESGILPNPVPIDVNQILETACRNLAKTYGSQPIVHRAAAVPLPTVMGSPDDLREAFEHILDNAYRFTSKDGSITIQTGTDRDLIRVEIWDTGIGIAEQHLSHIFETFWRLDEAHTTPGLGLGLPIAQKIIQCHAGNIEVSSVPGQGTCFKIVLPGVSKYD